MSKIYSESEVLLHTSKEDCWLIIHGKVYDVTKFLDDHPGGDDILVVAAVRGDATEEFDEIGHSPTAVSVMEGYLIGSYEGPKSTDGSRLKKANETKSILEEKQPSSSLFLVLLPLFVLWLAFGAWYYLNVYSVKA